MLEANFKLPIVFLIGSIIISVIISFFSLNILSYIIYASTLYIITYYTFGYIKGKKALVIDKDKISVRTPFRNKEFQLSDLENITVVENGLQIKAFVKSLDKEITICSNIYSVSLEKVIILLLKNKENSL